VRLANKLKQLKNPLHFCPLVHIYFIFYFLYFDIFEKYNVNVDLMKKKIMILKWMPERAENKFLNFELF